MAISKPSKGSIGTPVFSYLRDKIAAFGGGESSRAGDEGTRASDEAAPSAEKSPIVLTEVERFQRLSTVERTQVVDLLN